VYFKFYIKVYLQWKDSNSRPSDLFYIDTTSNRSDRKILLQFLLKIQSQLWYWKKLSVPQWTFHFETLWFQIAKHFQSGRTIEEDPERDRDREETKQWKKEREREREGDRSRRRDTWRKKRDGEGKGEWEMILKRMKGKVAKKSLSQD
jgi:hypothetical protein